MEVFYKNGILKISQNPHENTCGRVSVLILKFAPNGLTRLSLSVFDHFVQACNFIKKSGTNVFLWIFQKF